MCSSSGRSSCINTPNGPHARAGVEDECVPARQAHLYTRRVPPYLTVSAPGVATDPRHPHTRACISPWGLRARPPEHRHHAVHLPGRAEQGVGGRLDLESHAVVGRRHKGLVRRSTLQEGHAAGESRRRIGSPSGVVSCRASPNSPDGISPSSEKGFPSKSAPRRCRRPACRLHPARTSASPGSRRARAPGSAAGSSANQVVAERITHGDTNNQWQTPLAGYWATLLPSNPQAAVPQIWAARLATRGVPKPARHVVALRRLVARCVPGSRRRGPSCPWTTRERVQLSGASRRSFPPSGKAEAASIRAGRLRATAAWRRSSVPPQPRLHLPSK